MILVGSQRSGAGNLARHLLNDRDNDHVTLHELRGFVSSDLQGAFEEAHAVSLGTRCRQFLFSLSFNPPKEAEVGLDELYEAAERAEERLGLKGQPRALVVHEKNGRRHLHAVWSRIDADQMKAINLPFYKSRLNDLSRELFLDHGWDLPEGHKARHWKNPLNFTLAEWQQAQRVGLDPRELKQMFRETWERSDNLGSFRSALEEHGYFLAKGDRRGFVAVDLKGEVYSVARYTGIRTKDVTARLGLPDDLPSVDEINAANQRAMTTRIHDLLEESREQQTNRLAPLLEERAELRRMQRHERKLMEEGQNQRRLEENAGRQQRFRRGIGGILDFVTGRAAEIRKQNEQEAYQGHCRDRDQREALFEFQMMEQRTSQRRIDALRQAQRKERMCTQEQIAFLLDLEKDKNVVQSERIRTRHRGLSLS